MKTTMKRIAAITFLALFILVGNVYAKGVGKSALSLENENALVLEDWMLNEDVWCCGYYSFLTDATDETLAVENWMTDEFIWEDETIAYNMAEEKEDNLVVENWMTDAYKWKL